MDFVRQDQLLIRDALGIKPASKVDRLIEAHVAIVVTLDQQDG